MIDSGWACHGGGGLDPASLLVSRVVESCGFFGVVLAMRAC